MDSRAAHRLLTWYDQHRRDLPWRAAPGTRADPYKVWLSEIMLQQTTVAAVKPYYEAFLTRWPDLDALAQATSGEVMCAWAGLGYYSRARNLHACAQIVVNEHSGDFPNTEAGLLRLPGIGPYTAAAIAAIAFERHTLAVDGNVARVIARLFAIDTPAPVARSKIKDRATELVPAGRPGDFTQALMDLGATICTPRGPACGLCPLKEFCLGHALGSPESLPRKTERRSRPLRHGAAFYIRRADGAVLVRSRKPGGLLGGMTELPGTSWDVAYDSALASRQAPLAATFVKLDQEVTHAFTHFALRLDIFVAELAGGERAPAGYRFVSEACLDKEAFPSVMRKVIEVARRARARNPMSTASRFKRSRVR
jgi:A/G-specific adenine glycosylase